MVRGGGAPLDPRAGGPPALTEIDALASDGIVTLRPFRDDDVPAIVEACRDPEVVRWTQVPSPYDESDAREFLAAVEAQREAGTAVSVAIADAGTGEYLGSVDLRINDRDRGRGDIGYLVAPWARRRGAAVRAVRMLADYGFEKLGLGRIEIAVHPENIVSQRVAQRARFTREAVLRSYIAMRDGRHDGVLFSRVV